MKISKLAIATGLTTAIALGAFIESADAQVRRRRGNTYSPTANDEATVTNQFTLVDTLLDGTAISDQVLSDRNVGLFVGAIEDYALVSGGVQICSDSTPSCPESSFNSDPRYLYDSSGFPIINTGIPFETTTEPFDGDLLVELFKYGEDPLFPDNKIENIEIDSIAYTILEPGTGKPVSAYRLLLTGPSATSNIDKVQAINSLSYILENNLLGNSERVIFSSNESDFSDQAFIYPTDVSATFPGFGSGDVLLQNKFEQNVSTTPVPEPVNILGTLAALGVGALIKRKNQH